MSLTDEIALAKKATAVVMEVKKVALLASMMVCVILLCTVLRPASCDDCLKVLMKTKMSSTPMPMMTKNEITLSKPNVLIPERERRERETQILTNNNRYMQVCEGPTLERYT